MVSFLRIEQVLQLSYSSESTIGKRVHVATALLLLSLSDVREAGKRTPSRKLCKEEALQRGVCERILQA